MASGLHSVAMPAGPGRKLLPAVGGVLLLGVGIALGVALAPGGGGGGATPASPGKGGTQTSAKVSPKGAPAAEAPGAEAVPADGAVAKAKVDAAVEPPAPKAKRPKPRRKPKVAKTPSKPAKPAAGRFGALGKGKSQVAVTAPAAREEVLPATIGQAQILSVIKRHQRGVRSCYERQLKRDDSLRNAKVMLRFFIQGSGRTSSVKLARRYDGTVLKTCLKSLVGRWRFPRFSGEAIPVEYPLVLQASL